MSNEEILNLKKQNDNLLRLFNDLQNVVTMEIVCKLQEGEENLSREQQLLRSSIMKEDYSKILNVIKPSYLNDKLYSYYGNEVANNLLYNEEKKEIQDVLTIFNKYQEANKEEVLNCKIIGSSQNLIMIILPEFLFEKYIDKLK